LWIGDILIIDQFENDVTDLDTDFTYVSFSSTTPFSLVADQLVPIKIEYKESTGSAAFSLLWSSPSQPLELVPNFRLYPTVDEISGSPFVVSPTGRKPTLVRDVSLSIASWTQLICTFHAPDDDGGSPISSFTVEWFDNSYIYGPLEIQTLKISKDVIDGTFTLSSPSGFVYPYSIPYDVDAPTLAYILERLFDIGDVEVSDSDDDTAFIRRITFVSDIYDVASLSIDSSGLISLSDSSTALLCVSGLVASSGSLNCTSTDSQDGADSPVVIRSGDNGYETVSMDVGSDGDYSYVINNLVQDSAIQSGFGVRVVAVNTEGWSSIPTDGRVTVLKPMGIPDGPKNVEFLRAAGSDTAILVYWTEILFPEDRGSAVSAYVIQWIENSEEFTSDLIQEVVAEASDNIMSKRISVSGMAYLVYNITGRRLVSEISLRSRFNFILLS
jgi:hypothetical protein